MTGYETCGQTPRTCVPNDFLVPDSEIVRVLAQSLEQMISLGQRFGSDLRGMYIRVENVRLIDDSTVTAASCWYDPGVVIGPLDSTGNTTLVNDAITSSRVKFDLALVGAEWRVSREFDRVLLGSGDLCGGP